MAKNKQKLPARITYTDKGNQNIAILIFAIHGNSIIFADIVKVIKNQH